MHVIVHTDTDNPNGIVACVATLEGISGDFLEVQEGDSTGVLKHGDRQAQLQHIIQCCLASIGITMRMGVPADPITIDAEAQRIIDNANS